MKQFFTLCIFLVCKQIFSKCFFVANPAFGRIYGILIFMLAALRFSCAINIHNKRFDTKFFCIHLYFKLVMQKIPILIPINICNLIRFNKLNFIIHSIYNLTLLSFTLLFGNILLELFVFKSASVNFYILLNLFLSGKFFIISYSRADGSTDGRTYVSDRPNY